MLDWLVALQRPWPFRKYRLINPLLPATGQRRAGVFGYWFDLDLSDHIQRNIYIGCYEREETRIFKHLLGPGATLVDIGANVGYFTALGCSLVGSSGKVLAIEPNPTAFAKLDAMVKRNNITWCRLINAGVSEQAGQLTLYEPPASEHNLNSTMVPTPGYRPIDVPVLTLDSLLAQEQIGEIDLLKIDVEGHEPKVLAGAKDAMTAGRIRHVLCEFNGPWLEQAGSSSRGLLKQFKDFGYEVMPGAGRAEDLAQHPIVNLLFRKKA